MNFRGSMIWGGAEESQYYSYITMETHIQCVCCVCLHHVCCVCLHLHHVCCISLHLHHSWVVLTACCVFRGFLTLSSGLVDVWSSDVLSAVKTSSSITSYTFINITLQNVEAFTRLKDKLLVYKNRKKATREHAAIGMNKITNVFTWMLFWTCLGSDDLLLNGHI